MSSSHRQEIAQKKARLEALRKERENRQRAATDRTPSTSASPVHDSTELLDEIDKVISGLKRSPVPKIGWANSVFSAGEASNAAPSEQTTAADGTATSESRGRPLTQVKTERIYECSPSPPREEVHMYTKSVQTDAPWVPLTAAESSPPDDDAPATSSKRMSRRELRGREEELRQTIRREVTSDIAAAQKRLGGGPAVDLPFKVLKTEEIEVLTSSIDFMSFVEKSTKIIERALDQDMEYDILTDYTTQRRDVDDEDDDTTDGANAAAAANSSGRGKRRVKEVRQFYDARWSANRMISSIHFSQKKPELLLASYTDDPRKGQDPDGVVQVWNMHMRDRPELVFTAQSTILSVKFSQHHPHLVVGGSYSGEVLLWDMRRNQQGPVNASPITGEGHTHPVYCVDVIGTPNDNCIVSCSTDGAVRTWDFDVLRKPKQAFTLKKGAQAKVEDVNTTALAFPQNESTFFLVGTEEGFIYPCQRYRSATREEQGVDTRYKFKGHRAPVMSVDFHPVHGPETLGDLVLSSSLDWSVKLWRVPHTVNKEGSDHMPLMDIGRDDIVYDARWSPVKPSVFALVDGAGRLELWDLAHDTEEPVAQIVPESVKNTETLVSLNKVAWEPNEGKRLATGGLNGCLAVFEVGSGLGGKDDSKTEEWTAMKDLATRLERMSTA